MVSQTLSYESTWTKRRILPTTDSSVVTPVLKQQSIVSAGILSRYKHINVNGMVDTMLPLSKDLTSQSEIEDVEVPVVRAMKSVNEGAMASVIHIWEGIVRSVDLARNVMTVKLVDRSGLTVEHSADIDLQWVTPQDYELLKEGAVFYWTLFKETKRGSISNSQEIRFRRLPSWNRTQLATVWREAGELSAKFKREIRIAD